MTRAFRPIHSSAQKLPKSNFPTSQPPNVSTSQRPNVQLPTVMPAFGQFWCFNVLAKFSVVVVVVVAGGCLLLFVGACCACWCLLVVLVGGGCLCVWWVCSRFLGLSPGPPAGPPFPWTAQNFALFFLSPAGNFFLSSLSGRSSR